MPIVTSSDESLRDSVVEFLSRKKAENPDYRVLDVGGAANTWCDRYVDAYLDIRPVRGARHVIAGDINSDGVWREVAKERWDFTLCTHVLEDVRAPDFVIDRLLSVSGAGFIAMPHKHTELSQIESRFWLGYCHHRWIFTIDEGRLKMIAKLPLVNYFAPRHRFWHALGRSAFLQKALRFSGLPTAGRGLDWVDDRKCGRGELGFQWDGAFDYQLINGDYAGDSMLELAELYREALRRGI